MKYSLFTTFLKNFFPLLAGLAVAIPTVGRANELPSGANALVCRNGSGMVTLAQSLDYFEAREVFQSPPLMGDPGLQPEQKAQLVLKQVEDRVRIPKADEFVLNFSRQSHFLKGVELKLISNIETLLIPDGCAVEQVSIRVDSELLPYHYQISKDIWDKLDNANRATVILHHLVLESGISRPSLARRMVSRLISSSILELTRSELYHLVAPGYEESAPSWFVRMDGWWMDTGTLRFAHWGMGVVAGLDKITIGRDTFPIAEATYSPDQDVVYSVTPRSREGNIHVGVYELPMPTFITLYRDGSYSYVALNLTPIQFADQTFMVDGIGFIQAGKLRGFSFTKENTLTTAAGFKCHPNGSESDREKWWVDFYGDSNNVISSCGRGNAGMEYFVYNDAFYRNLKVGGADFHRNGTLKSVELIEPASVLVQNKWVGIKRSSEFYDNKRIKSTWLVTPTALRTVRGEIIVASEFVEFDPSGLVL